LAAPSNSQFQVGSGGTAYTQLSTSIASNVDRTFYTSFLLDLSAGGTGSSTFFNLGFAALNGADNTDQLNFGKSSTNANFGTTFNGVFEASGVAIDATKNYLVVLKAEMTTGADTLSFKIFDSALDTVSATEPGPGTWDGVRTIALANNITFTGFGMRTGSNQIMNTDEIRIGDTWGSVVIPEPSSYALLGGFLALGWVMVRRRR
jgi:hypothetical protein